jgi:low affinity Fe/Cu permease
LALSFRIAIQNSASEILIKCNGMPDKHRKPYVQAREEVKKTGGVNFWFSRFASSTAQVVGHPYVFFVAVLALVLWAISGPYFHFSDTWQLIINTGTTIITFLVVFLIQNTQNRDAKALHLKLDELIRSHHPANDDLIDIQKLSDEELDELEKRYESIRKECEARRAASQSNATLDADKIVNNSMAAKNGGTAKKPAAEKPVA